MQYGLIASKILGGGGLTPNLKFESTPKRSLTFFYFKVTVLYVLGGVILGDQAIPRFSKEDPKITHELKRHMFSSLISVLGLTPPSMIGGTFMYLRCTYFLFNKSYLLVK